MGDDTGLAGRDLLAFRADCANCFGLCCVALPFARSVDFAFTKSAGDPCRNLGDDFRCGIHTELAGKGFAGCSTFDCFGAGQLVAQHTFGGTSWRDAPETADTMFEVFPVVRALQEILWYLACARELAVATELVDEIDAAADRMGALTLADTDALLAIDLDAQRAEANPLLGRASAVARRASQRGTDSSRGRAGVDLIGAKLRGADLRSADLRGALLIGADLTGADLALADVIGADLRGATVVGANLGRAIYLTQFQLNAARGDGSTVIPDGLKRPTHWR